MTAFVAVAQPHKDGRRWLVGIPELDGQGVCLTRRRERVPLVAQRRLAELGYPDAQLRVVWVDGSPQ